MKTTASVLLSLCAVCAFAAEEAAAPAAAPAAALPAVAGAQKIDAAVSKGVAYLAAHQNEDGSLSNPRTPGLTGLALWAMSNSGKPECADAVKKAVAFILSCAQEDGGIYKPAPGRKGGSLSTYNTAICLTALSFANSDAALPVILKAREFLAASQLEGDDSFAGGFGYDKPDGERRYADLSNTHYAVQAMRVSQRFEDFRPAGEKRVDIDWDAALKFVSSMQAGPDTGDNAGGFGYSPADAKAGKDRPAPKEGEGKPEAKEGEGKRGGRPVSIRSYGSITYAGLEAMSYCKLDKTDARVRSMLDWAAKHWTVDENPGQGDTGLYYFYEVMGRALAVAGIAEIPRVGEDADKGAIDWRTALADKVMSLQKADGSWANTNARFWENDPVVATTFSLLALEAASGK